MSRLPCFRVNYAYAQISIWRRTAVLICIQVIVGSNGAGKSTILKLIVRLYDPEEGTILFGGHDIRTLRLSDLRQATSVLFQDYTHFPLSVRLFPCIVALTAGMLTR